MDKAKYIKNEIMFLKFLGESIVRAAKIYGVRINYEDNTDKMLKANKKDLGKMLEMQKFEFNSEKLPLPAYEFLKSTIEMYEISLYHIKRAL